MHVFVLAVWWPQSCSLGWKTKKNSGKLWYNRPRKTWAKCIVYVKVWVLYENLDAGEQWASMCPLGSECRFLKVGQDFLLTLYSCLCEVLLSFRRQGSICYCQMWQNDQSQTAFEWEFLHIVRLAPEQILNFMGLMSSPAAFFIVCWLLKFIYFLQIRTFDLLRKQKNTGLAYIFHYLHNYIYAK